MPDSETLTIGSIVKGNTGIYALAVEVLNKTGGGRQG